MQRVIHAPFGATCFEALHAMQMIWWYDCLFNNFEREGRVFYQLNM